MKALAFRRALPSLQTPTQLYSGSYDRSLKLFDLSTMGYVETLFGHQAPVLSIDALRGETTVREAVAMTRDFVTTLYGAAELSVARDRSLKETFQATRAVMDPKFSSFAIYEHCLPFNVARAYDEASGIDHPRIWTAERDREMWAALQGP